MSSIVYSFIWPRISRDERARKEAQSTDSKPVTSTANSTEINNTPNSGVYSTDKSQTNNNK
jgi:hypothetical protein